MAFRIMRRRPTLAQILRTLRAEQPRLRDEYGVGTLQVFGPYVKGDDRRDSQLEVLVEFDCVPGMLKYVRLERHLSELLGVEAHLVLKSTLEAEVSERILKEAVPV